MGAHQSAENAAATLRRKQARGVASQFEATEIPDYPESPQPPHSEAPLGRQGTLPGPPRPNSLPQTLPPILPAVPFYNTKFLNMQPRPPYSYPDSLLK